MTPELIALENVLADLFRDISTAARLADMAGLAVEQIDRTGSSADVWHSIITMAMQDGVLGDLVARAKTERPRNKELPAAWAAYQAATQPPTQTIRRRPTRGQAGDMSDYRSDERRDARIDQMQRDMTDMREKIAGLVVQVTALTEMVKAQNEHGKQYLTNAQFAAIVVAAVLIAGFIFSAVWFGGGGSQ